ncbi:asc-type amino acid transporter 1 isoform X2 [Nelusetta ayraudi]|uniref:asc-type amino acid transporter 1 isoform X2 n=1 Tax=Nelusetta ayraudi TaxID=303726 RepID=UPI003F7100D5
MRPWLHVLCRTGCHHTQVRRRLLICDRNLWRPSGVPVVMECCTHHVSNHTGCHRTHLLKLRPAASLPVLRSSIHCHQTPGHHMCLVRWATRIQDIFTVGKLLALVLIIVVGLVQISKGHYEALRPSVAFEFRQEPSVGQIALAFLQASFAYSGWNFLNYVTEEVVEPRKNLPRAIYISIPLVTLVYTMTNIAYFSSMTPEELLASNAVAVTFGEKLLGMFSWVMPISVALSTFGGINGYLFTSSRLCFSGAREGHLPYLLAMIHLKNCTPIPALLLCCIATIVILCIGETHNLINYVSFINYLSYGVTIAGLIYLRKKKPHLARPIKVNMLIPFSYMLFWVVLLGFSLYSEPVVCGLGMVIMLTGVPIYFVGVRWRDKPKWIYRLVERVTYVGQKLCYVVFPQADPSETEPLTTHKNSD